MIVELRLLIFGAIFAWCLAVFGMSVVYIQENPKTGLILSFIISSCMTYNLIMIIWTIVRYFAGGHAGAIAEVAHGVASAGGGF